MPTCWSCLVIIEQQDVTVCPLCGADQKHPIEIIGPDSRQPPTWASVLQDWGIVIVVIIVGVGTIAGMLWYNFGERSVSPAVQAAGVAARSLRDLREALSTYALSMKDMYPTALDSLGDRASLPTQAALSAGYKLQYHPNPSSSDGAPRGFVILARTEKSDYMSLCIDESGVVRATQEDRPATARDPPF